MQIAINSLARCGGNNHLHVQVTVGGNQRTVTYTLAELQADPFTNIEEAKEALLAWMRSRAKAAGASNFAQLRTALEGQTAHL